MKQVKENTSNDWTTAGNQRKSGLEQHYTKGSTAKWCVDKFKDAVPNWDSYLYVEPCAGTGSFLDEFPVKQIGFDIDPKIKGVHVADWLEIKWNSDLPHVFITNPPFGRGNSLSVKFFNKCAETQPNYIGFLIPASWRKWSILNRLDNNYHLIADHDLPEGQNFYSEDDPNSEQPATLKCIFQIYEWRREKREKIKVKDNGYLIKADPKDADVKLTTQGWGCGKVEISFDRDKKVNGNRYFKIKDPSVLVALMDLDYSMFTKNCAYVKSISFDEINYLLNDYYGT